MATRLWHRRFLVLLSATGLGAAACSSAPGALADVRVCADSLPSDARSDLLAARDAVGLDANRLADVSSVTDASTAGLVVCGVKTCDRRRGEICCYDGSQRRCAPDGQCPAYAEQCDGPEDCPQAACCQSYDDKVHGLACVAASSCPGQIVCRRDQDCPTGQACCDGELIEPEMARRYCLPRPSCPDPSPTTGVPCGGETCLSPQVCCEGSRFTCGSASPCTGLAVACDGPEDCPAIAPACCFASLAADSWLTCVAPGDCSGSTRFLVCHGTEDCTDGQVCVGTPMLDTHRLCI
jgi:hypothetical protein